ncbi:response regulator [Pseudobacteriovorax antillogorgiicola]|uniref:Tetratricopeptide repeat-containing protein n=1 Tax=Pseudobacteriovorax antillogorgiicola TaxID=1513793 RepID=A0A1Y6CIW2_9BACT|nr:response regulator [Pseudobacteriovorax antillogorgiicola]TCS47913.1 tetratricopeptide repeat protein [Pseudobacteriovorax antillogorgiicola]SMF57862.1 Tetratricopeptide repeat-containing protein [Pseudobacteriovorax antillogorgiicola]
MTTNTGKRVAVMDADLHYREILTQYCLEEGYQDVAEYESPDDLAKALDTEKFDLFIVDWSAKGQITGAGIVNRIRAKQATALTPILVFSGVISEHDMTLTEEFFSMDFLQKPVTQSIFRTKLQAVNKEYQWYQANFRLIDKAFKKGCENLQAIKSILKLLDKAPNPIPLGLLVSDVLLEKNQLSACEAVQKKILAVDKKNIRALSNLGKIALERKENHKAYQFLKAADKISPDNLGRICTLGQLELQEQESQLAKDTFARGLEIDSQSEAANAGAIIAQNLDEFLCSKPPSISKPFACLMNSIGISKVQSGAIDDGITHYQSALSFLNNRRDKTKVMFNIGYGYFRQEDYENAMAWFERSFQESQDRFAKASTYAELVKKQFGIKQNLMTLSNADDLDQKFPDSSEDVDEFFEMIG